MQTVTGTKAMTKEEQEKDKAVVPLAPIHAAIAWEAEFKKHRMYPDWLTARLGKDLFQSRLLEELEKRRESILTKMASLDNNGEHYQVDHDDYTAELVSCDEIIELVKTIKPLKNYGTRNYQ